MSAAKKIAHYIRTGWKLSAYHCPVCNNPLVEKENRYYCAVCDREVKVVRDEAEYRKALMEGVLERLRSSLIEAINQVMQVEDWAFNEKYLGLLEKYLELIAKVNRALKE